MIGHGLEAWFLNERPLLLRFLRARLANPDEAEDLLQEVWLKLRRVPSGPVSHPAAYLFRLANNLAIDTARSRRQRSSREGAWHQANLEDEVIPSPEWSMLQRERLAQVDERIKRLPERTRAIFKLYRYEDMPRRTIAEALQISVSAVEKHLTLAYRAIHGLRNEETDFPERVDYVAVGRRANVEDTA